MNNEEKLTVVNINNGLNVLSDDCVKDIRAILERSRSLAYKQVNAAMVQANWYIGRRIVLQEQKGEKRAEYGASLIKKLSKELGDEFGKSVSVAQLWNCRQFYGVFSDEKILYTLCRELNWSQIRLIMRITSEEERNFYIENCRNGAWSVRELERNIKTDMFHRVVANQGKETTGENNTPENVVKDPYILEFLDLKPGEKCFESNLETSIITNLQKFMLEMGKGFSFVDRQMHIATESSDFYIDLVFYNYILKCFVLIDLKTSKLTHQDIGQMDMYVRMFDDLKRAADDNPTIGIIFCTDKEESVVKYSVLSDSRQLFASKYKTVLPSEDELAVELERNRRCLMEEF